MNKLFSRIQQKPRDGNDPLHSDGMPLGATVLDFWRWSASDLLSNATRGVLAEFIVAKAMNIPLDEGRDEWGAFDLRSPEGINIEVKSAAYIQSWHQEKPSNVIFGVPKTRKWDPETNKQQTEARRQADVYVFALLAHLDHAVAIDPLNVDQWLFFVLPTEDLNTRTRSQHSITIPTLITLTGGGVAYSALRQSVQSAYAEHCRMVGCLRQEPSTDDPIL